MYSLKYESSTIMYNPNTYMINIIIDIQILYVHFLTDTYHRGYIISIPSLYKHTRRNKLVHDNTEAKTIATLPVN